MFFRLGLQIGHYFGIPHRHVSCMECI